MFQRQVRCLDTGVREDDVRRVVDLARALAERDDPDDYDDDGGNSTSPELLAMVPRTLGFWAVAE